MNAPDLNEQIAEGWEQAEQAVREQARQLAEKGVVIATMNTPISINALKTTLKRLKERHGSKVQIVPHEWGLEFVLHPKGVVPK